MIGDLLRKIIYTIYGWQLPTVLIFACIMLIAWTLINRYLPGKLCKVFNYIVTAVIFTVIVFFTMSNRTVRTERPYRLIPFAHYFTSQSGIETLWLNAFFFLPLGLSLPYILPGKIKHKATTTIMAALVFSTLIEAVQYIFALGLCETDDVIMNTLGAAIGTMSYIACTKLSKVKDKNSLHNND